MELFYCVLIGYLSGTVNPSYIFARIKGFDIRTRGSGNAGASNVLILCGKAAGAVCALFDIAKAYFAILLANYLFPEFPHVFAVTGTACVVGHVFPFYMKFRGGKGLACLGGMILYFDFRVFIVMLCSELVIALVSDYICFVPITASVVFPIVYAAMTSDFFGGVVLLLMTAIILTKHVENIKRILNGTEMHLSFLWRPESEVDRIKETVPISEEEIKSRFGEAK